MRTGYSALRRGKQALQKAEGSGGGGASLFTTAMYRLSSSSSHHHSTEASSSSSRSKRRSSPASRSSRSRADSRPRSSRSRRRSPSSRGRRHHGRRRSRSQSRSRRRSRSRSRSRSSRRRRSPRRSSSPRRESRRYSLDRYSYSPHQQSPSQYSECSVEHKLRMMVGDDRFGLETPERKKLSDRLDSPVDSLIDVDRDDLAYDPVFKRHFSHLQQPFCEENPSSPFDMKCDEDYRSKDVFVSHSDCTVSYNHIQDRTRETDWDGELLRKSSYSPKDGRQEHFHYDRDERLLDRNIDPKDFLPGTQKYYKQSFSRSPSPKCLDEDFRELELAKRKREEVELSCQELPGNSYIFPESIQPVQPSEPWNFYRPEEASPMPKKSILKKRVEDSSLQPCSTDSFSMDVENFLKQFHKSVVTESEASKESERPVHDWKPHSGQQQDASFEHDSEDFLIKRSHESAWEPIVQQSDLLLPHERASQDGSGFSFVLGMMANSANTQEKRRHSFPDDNEDEEKFLYGNGDESDCHINSPYAQKLTDGKETVSLPSSSVKVGTSEPSQPENEKILDLLKTIGLDIGVAEICKLAARTQERLHGKKTSCSPDRHLVASHKQESHKRHRNRSDTLSPESSRKYSLSPPGSFPPPKDISSVSISDCNESKTGLDNPFGTVEQSVSSVPIIPSAPPCPPNSSPNSPSYYSVPHLTPFPTTQLPQCYPFPLIPPPSYIVYGQHMTYEASDWPMYAQQDAAVVSDVYNFVTPEEPADCLRPNLKVINTTKTVIKKKGKKRKNTKKEQPVPMKIPTVALTARSLPQLSLPVPEGGKERISDEKNQASQKQTVIPTAAPTARSLPQLSLPVPKGGKERISDEKNRASQKQKVIEEREKLKSEQEIRRKELYYVRMELNRLSRLQEEMLQKKRKEDDPLLVEVSRLRESIAKEVAELEIKHNAGEKKKSELDKVAQILGINIFYKSRKLSSENKESSEKSMPANAKNEDRFPSPIKS